MNKSLKQFFSVRAFSAQNRLRHDITISRYHDIRGHRGTTQYHDITISRYPIRASGARHNITISRYHDIQGLGATAATYSCTQSRLPCTLNRRGLRSCGATQKPKWRTRESRVRYALHRWGRKAAGPQKSLNNIAFYAVPRAVHPKPARLRS